MTYHCWISKLLWQKLSLVDTIIVRDCTPSVDQASKNLMNHPYPENSQPTCLSFRRGNWDVIIVRMNTQITKHLCSVRHVTSMYGWLKKETVFWSIICSFPSRLHFLLNTFLKLDHSCVDWFVSFYHKYVSSMYSSTYFKFGKEYIDSIAVILKIYL